MAWYRATIGNSGSTPTPEPLYSSFDVKYETSTPSTYTITQSGLYFICATGRYTEIPSITVNSSNEPLSANNNYISRYIFINLDVGDTITFGSSTHLIGQVTLMEGCRLNNLVTYTLSDGEYTYTTPNTDSLYFVYASCHDDTDNRAYDHSTISSSAVNHTNNNGYTYTRMVLCTGDEATIDMYGYNYGAVNLFVARIEAVETPGVSDLDKMIARSPASIKSDVTSIGYSGNYSAFRQWTALESVRLPNVTTVPANAFNGCTNLTMADLRSLTTIPNGCFASCSKLSIVNVSSATTIKSGAFNYCYGLEAIDLPLATTLESYAFEDSRNLQSVNMPLVQTIGAQVFNGCALAFVDLPSATSIGSRAFDNCPFTEMVIRTNSVCALNSIDAFRRTAFADGGAGGTLYVPQDLISSYESANNWSTILGYANNSIAAIEGSIYEES